MLPKKAMDAIADDMTPKFLATANADGVPNVVLVTTTYAPDPKTVAVGQIMMRKTQRNMDEYGRVGMMVLTQSMELWAVRGELVEWQTTGQLIDKLNESPFVRYNAYMGIRRAAVIRIDELIFETKLSVLAVAADLLKVKAVRGLARSGDGEPLPAQIVEKFNRARAVRVLSALDADGYPMTLLAMSMMPANASTLVFTPRLQRDEIAAIPNGAPVAVSVSTFDPISYQVKGAWNGVKSVMGVKLGSMTVAEAYTAGPPRPGERIV